MFKRTALFSSILIASTAHAQIEEEPRVRLGGVRGERPLVGLPGFRHVEILVETHRPPGCHVLLRSDGHRSWRVRPRAE